MRQSDKYLSKVVIRHLPPSMTEDRFLEQVSPIPELNYFHFSKADLSLGQFAFTRACIDFTHQEDIFVFKDKFDGYVFLDSRGYEYPAIVEFSPYQKVPRKKLGPNGQNISAKKRDPKSGTIQDEPDYKAFLEAFEQAKNESNLPSAEIYLEEIEARDRELKANHGLVKINTPLIEFVKQKRIEKHRQREERKKQPDEKKRNGEEHRKREKERIIQHKLKKRDRKRREKDREKDPKRDCERERIGKKCIDNSVKRNERKIREKDAKKENYETPNFTVKLLQNNDKDRSDEVLETVSQKASQIKPQSSLTSDKSPKLEKSLRLKETKNELENKKEERKVETKRVRNKDRPALEIYRPGMRRALGIGSNQSPTESKERNELNPNHEKPIRKTKIFSRSRTAE